MLPWVAYQEISQEYRLIFLIDIIETLEAQGLDREKSQLYDYIDVDALEQLLYSSNGNVEVQFAVEIRLTVTPEGVDVLDDKAPLPSGRVGDWCHARVDPIQVAT